MCGITGFFAFNQLGLSQLNHLDQSVDYLTKRGPDSRGTYVNQKVGLGHRRLSIIDTSDNSRQPMTEVSGRFTLVFNGEIYNYRELRAQLECDGIKFRTSSDTEVLLKLFQKKGKECLGMLNGFFCFAIYDSLEKSLFIARDRLGIKPLLYYSSEDFLAFGSEMKALLAYDIPRDIDFNALKLYLQFNYTPGPFSMLKGVKKLLPGHFLEMKNGKVNIDCWYKIPYSRDNMNPEKLSYEQQKKQLVELLDRSVKRRMVADVPLGAFLSGGIDSSVITALASRQTDKLNTFSIGYKDEPFFDETHYARQVAAKFKTEHTVFSLTNEDLYEHLFDVLDYLDEPFADSSALPVYILSQKTRQKATVALSGDGADEMFSGYNKHLAAYRAMNGGVTAMAINSMLPLWKVMPKSRNNPLGNKFRQLQRFAEGLSLSEGERYWRWASITREKEVDRLLNSNAKSKLEKQSYQDFKTKHLEHFSTQSDINETLYTDMHLVLVNDMLTKVDMMSMANSLEVRVPFLDHEIVEFAFQLPESSKINKGMKKRILQDAFRNVLPEDLYKRPKHGFEVPLLKWLRTGLKSMIIDDLLADSFIEEQGIFDLEEIRNLKAKLFSTNPEDSHAKIWALLVFQYWWKKYISSK
ncbi:asparagine synthase (glutamine-hydrolyzing) [Xanthovirga aplysinae]|uniref:asparagine synthase (glutamine-hydrolyzing) n=1 Tax=Xanthovirga aplysinae TaxID=2529853 RepID=UPI0012BD113B|nr:asparagine synthase (glutamine-hydrolyzing) [Xanthovirga aplysinae]MTI32067.1 asparagine synthase (glutamine-hydrolyzing) [Xanthovirga aplysinae]